MFLVCNATTNKGFVGVQGLVKAWKRGRPGATLVPRWVVTGNAGVSAGSRTSRHHGDGSWCGGSAVRDGRAVGVAAIVRVVRPTRTTVDVTGSGRAQHGAGAGAERPRALGAATGLGAVVEPVQAAGRLEAAELSWRRWWSACGSTVVRFS